MASEFPRFLELPAEIRLMIWHHAINNIPKQRLVTVKNPSNPPAPSDTADSPHALLHTCTESRELFLPRYISAFGLPKPGWEYTDTRSFIALNSILRELSLPRCVVDEGVLPITIYMNTHPEMVAMYEDFANLGKPYPLLGPSLWFDAANDTLLFRRARKNGFIGWSTPGLKLLDKSGDLNIRNLAFEVSGIASTYIRTGDCFWNRLHLRTCTMQFPTLSTVETVSFLMRDWCEVVTFALDDRDLLRFPGQWCFSMDTESSIFKTEMGDQWLNVTWRVIMARDGARTLCQLLQTWKPNGRKWRHWQEYLYKSIFGDTGNWRSIEWEKYGVPSLPVFVEGAKRLTIMGPS